MGCGIAMVASVGMNVIERVVVPTNGSVLAGRDAGGDPMKATDLLKKQHRQVEKLFKQCEKTEDAGERRELMEQIGSALKLHTKLEEEIFYPAVREMGTSKAEEMVDEAYEEHHVVDLVLAELPKVDPEDERFQAKMTVLSELVEHHVDEEEDEMFPMAEKKLGSERMKELGQQMEQMAGGAGARRAA
jgi:hemerythrin superfamily protein